MSKKLTEALQIDCLIAPQDVGTADVTGATYIDVTGCKRFVIAAKAGAVTAAKILTVTPMQAKDAAGTDAKALGDAVAVAGAGGNAPADVEIEKLSADLDAAGGFTHVSVKLGIDENAKLGAAYLIRGERRYAP
jgi:hypothetical protein